MPIVLTAAGCGSRTEEFLKTTAEEEAPEELPEASPEPEAPTEEPAPVYVYVCGAVVSPGVYELPENSRVYQAVDKAGGFLEDAAREAVNLAQPVYDGEQLWIPSLTDVAEGSAFSGAAGSGADDGRIDLNSATADALLGLPGIGEAKAAAIISWREKNGPFTSAEELMQVEGIKEGIYNKIKDKITVR